MNNIKVPFKLVQELEFDEDDGMWTVNTNLVAENGFDESSGLQPCFLEENPYPDLEDCIDSIKELFGYLLEVINER